MTLCKAVLKLFMTFLIFWNSFVKGEGKFALEEPKIIFERNSSTKWANITFQEQEFEGPAFYSDKGEILYASCSAPYPITWNFDRFINPVSIIRILEPERTFNPDKFTIKLAAFFNTAIDEPSLASSLRIQCKKVDAIFPFDEFSLLVKGNLNGTLLPPKSNLIEATFSIPCRTTSLLEPVQLFKLNGTEEIKVEGVKYIPWDGFLEKNCNNFQEGVYFCRQGSSEVKFIVKKTPLPIGMSYLPWDEEKLRYFSDEDIYFNCYSYLEEEVELEFEGDSVTNLDITYYTNSTGDKEVLITPLDKKAKKIEGKVKCLKKDVLVKEWTFEFIKAPEIFFDDYFSEMHCLTDFEEGVEVEAKSVRCSNDIGCSYYERCLEDGNVCDHLGRIVYSNKRRSKCAPLADRRVRDCVNLYYTSWNGVALCKVDGLSRTWNYFTALDLHKYTDWKKVDENDLLRLEKDEEKLNGFRCTGVGFLFSNSLAFELHYADNSTELIQGEGEDGKVTIHEHPSPYKIQGFHVVSSLELFKPDNVKSIKCVGSFWNNTEIVKTPAYNL